MSHIITLDLETTIVDGSPDYIHTANEILCVEWKCSDWTHHDRGTQEGLIHMLRTGSGLLIGHNLPFDIGWMLSRKWVTEESLAKGWTIWDTQLAHYLLTGHEGKFASLELVAQHHALPFTKDEGVKAAFASGTTIDKKKLADYCHQDVLVTEKIAQLQMAEAEERGMLPLLLSQMEMRLVTTVMRVTGMKIDGEALRECGTSCKDVMLDADIDAALYTATLADEYGIPFLTRLNALKPPQLHTMLWGGINKHQERVTLPDRYKTGPRKGECKTKLVTNEVKFAGLKAVSSRIPSDVPENTEADTLRAIIAELRPTPGVLSLKREVTLMKLLEKVLVYREAKKIHSTYVLPTEAKLATYGRVHPTIHMTSTNTGRTSCADPNLQNVPVGSFGNYRRALVADQGYTLVEFDYSQLEVVVAALLSKDKSLAADVLHNDMHSELYKDVYGHLPSADERRNFKRVVFAAFYGAGAKTLAEHGDISRGAANKFLRAFQERYPDYHAYKGRIKQWCEANGVMTEKRVLGIQMKECPWKSPTGRVYTFKQTAGEDYKTKEVVARWSDQQIANYPVQGTATADIVPMMVGYTWRTIRRLYTTAEVQFIMSVHDSLLVEVLNNNAMITAKVRELLSNVPVLMMDTFGIDVGELKFEVGMKSGKNWEDMKEEK